MNIFITGGAGFIGINAAHYFLKLGHRVTIFDNFSRPGTRTHVTWLTSLHRKNLRVVKGDIRDDIKKLQHPLKGADVVLHLAGQVAVTTSVADPFSDFEMNASGTLNVLEAIRRSGKNPIVIYSSTNKVYGSLKDMAVKETATRYKFRQNTHGIPESHGLDFYSPYGCSKGSADQYVHDYARIYGLRTVVFRQSCIYGPHQFGLEDQGWVAWFIIRLLQGGTLTIYGDGKQVRDVLYVDDLIAAYDAAIKHIHKTQGQIYNIGGGPKNSMSVWHEFRPMLEKLFDKKITVTFADWRPGDQRIYISDIRKSYRDFGWKPTISVTRGIAKLYSWLKENWKQA